jgi:hypothetical protein
MKAHRCSSTRRTPRRVSTYKKRCLPDAKWIAQWIGFHVAAGGSTDEVYLRRAAVVAAYLFRRHSGARVTASYTASTWPTDPFNKRPGQAYEFIAQRLAARYWVTLTRGSAALPGIEIGYRVSQSRPTPAPAETQSPTSRGGAP